MLKLNSYSNNFIFKVISQIYLKWVAVAIATGEVFVFCSLFLIKNYTSFNGFALPIG
jgi:hypothetical protein